MHAVDLIATSMPEQEREPLPCEPVTGTCCLTGQHVPCVPRKSLFGKSFTNMDAFAAPESPLVSVSAFLALKYKWQRMSLWLTDGREFIRPDRAQVRTWVLDGVEADLWAAFVTTSYKKHGFRAPVNRHRFGRWLYDETIIDCTDNERVRELFDGMCEWQKKGISRPTMESLSCPVAVMAKIGIDIWHDFEQWAKPRQGRVWSFLCYLLPSKEEMKHDRQDHVPDDSHVNEVHETQGCFVFPA